MPNKRLPLHSLVPCKIFKGRESSQIYNAAEYGKAIWTA